MTDGFDRAPTGLAPPPDPMVGQLLDGRYQIMRKLGEGGMGEVYAAQHIRLGKGVAIKLLRHEIVSNAEAVKRFEQEARSASSIGHKNIIGILDSGDLPDGRIYLSMELLEGAPLNELMKTPMPADRLLNILIQTGHGLGAAHKKGIVHRDMKPENIFVTITPEGEEVPKLLDFGIAKMSGNEGNNHLTKTGTIFGTPFYMAPEQALGQNVDQRADIYAVGVIMYEMFGGAVPFAGESFMAILTQHITAEPKPLARMAAEHGRVVPPGLEAIIARAMKKEPEQRFQNMDELVGALVTVYRQVAGSGMSSYMHAMPGGPMSAMMPTALPGSLPGGYPTPSPMPPSPTPMPYGPQGGPPLAHQPISGGYASVPSGTPYPGSSATFEPARKSKTGLIVALVIVLLGAGGAAAFFILQNKDKADDGAGEQVAGGGGESPDGPTVPQGGGDPVKPSDAGAAVVEPAVAIDAGAAVVDPVKPIDAGAAIDPGPVEPLPAVTVLVNSDPAGAEVFKDGKKLKGRTPMNLKVTPGQPVTLTLEKGRRYRKATITLDGSVETVTPKLEKIERPDGPGPGPGPDPGTDPEPDDPCKKNPDLAQCQLE